MEKNKPKKSTKVIRGVIKTENNLPELLEKLNRLLVILKEINKFELKITIK